MPTTVSLLQPVRPLERALCPAPDMPGGLIGIGSLYGHFPIVAFTLGDHFRQLSFDASVRTFKHGHKPMYTLPCNDFIDHSVVPYDDGCQKEAFFVDDNLPVSYTHLTLPTILRV